MTQPTAHCHIHGEQTVPDLFHVGDTVMVRQSDRAPIRAYVVAVDIHTPTGTNACTCGQASARYTCSWGDRPSQWDTFYPHEVTEA